MSGRLTRYKDFAWFVAKYGRADFVTKAMARRPEDAYALSEATDFASHGAPVYGGLEAFLDEVLPLIFPRSS